MRPMKIKNPMGLFIGIGLAGWLLLFGIVFNVKAADYYVLTTVSRNFDSWTVDSCRVFLLGGWLGANPDSAKWFNTAMVEPQTGTWPTTHDTLARYAIVTNAQLDEDYNPQIYAVWWLSDGRVIRDNAPNISVFGISATASVDYDSIYALILSAVGGGAGAWSDSIIVLRRADSTPVGAGAVVRLVPNGGGDNYQLVTDANGTAPFSMDTDTFFVYIWALGYQQEAVPDTNAVPGADTKDTVWVAAVTPAAAASPALTPVTFTFMNSLGSGIKNVVLRYQLESKYTPYHLRDSSITIDPSSIFEARSNASGVVTVQVTPNDSILVLGGKTDQTKWRFKAYTPDGLVPLLGNDGVSIAVPASQTAWVYPQDFE